MNKPTSDLQKAIKESKFAFRFKGLNGQSVQCDEQIFDSLTSAAKETESLREKVKELETQLGAVTRENGLLVESVDESSKRFQRLSKERDTLKADYKQAVEALEGAIKFCDDSRCDAPNGIHHDNCTVGRWNKIKSLPSAIEIMKGGKV